MKTPRDRPGFAKNGLLSLPCASWGFGLRAAGPQGLRRGTGCSGCWWQRRVSPTSWSIWPGAFSIRQGDTLSRRHSFSHKEQTMNPPSLPEQQQSCIARALQNKPADSRQIPSPFARRSSTAGGQRCWGNQGQPAPCPGFSEGEGGRFPGGADGAAPSGYGANGVSVPGAASAPRGTGFGKAAVSRASGWAPGHLPGN